MVRNKNKFENRVMYGWNQILQPKKFKDETCFQIKENKEQNMFVEKKNPLQNICSLIKMRFNKPMCILWIEDYCLL